MYKYVLGESEGLREKGRKREGEENLRMKVQWRKNKEDILMVKTYSFPQSSWILGQFSYSELGAFEL